MAGPDWIGTYRLQVHRGFPLAAAAAVLPYLRALGISHVYLSPCLQAAPGSEHGYDLADPSRVSDDLGGETAWADFQRAAREHGLGVLLDIVPNHMTTAAANPWWTDVLQHGPYSSRARCFDLSPTADGENWRLHLCTLEKTYGETLREGGFAIDAADEEPCLTGGGQRWPLNPLSWSLIASDADAADRTGTEQTALELRAILQPDETARQRYRVAVAAARERWQSLRKGAAGRARLERAAAGFAGDPDRMHALIRRQYFRLRSWRLEGESVNYRRFFNIGSLVGIRVEDPEVFAAVHARVVRMIEAGEVAGLRVDHPDGLRDPAGYLAKLRTLVPDGPIYVEKILDADEALPVSWPVDGTVGYDFLSKVNRLAMNAEKIDRLTAIYADFTGHTVNFPRLVREKKLAIINEAFIADRDRLVDLALALARRDWRTQDLSRRQLREALVTLTAMMPVYRTYLPGQPGPDRAIDLSVLEGAVAEARAFADKVAPEVFDFLRAVLAGEEPDEAARDFIARWQQLAPAVMAKGTEDTTFYLYDRLVSGNEVGSQPSLVGIPAEQFHAYCHRLSERWPRNLLATSTHDNKRSEDVRVRISLLTEIPERWAEAVQAWSRLNHEAWGGRQPDRHAEYLLYQTLVGAWPISVERAQAYMLKACREARVHTSWHEPDRDYEGAIAGFVGRILASKEFLASLGDFVAPLQRPAGVHSLAQTLLKLTAPGVPDFYQGTELWDLSLVDPDNRRAVDFDVRRALLARHAGAKPADMLAEWESGWPKLWLIATVLEFRRQHAAWFAADESYEPMAARGPRLAHVLGFRRGENLVVLVPRFTLSLGDDWGDTRVTLRPGTWRNVFTGETLIGDVGMGALFAAFPVALLFRTDREGASA